MKTQPGGRVIVEVRYGPMAARKGIIQPGGSLVVGRSDEADLPMTYGEELSAKHFEITWDGKTCRLRDLESHNGTQLSGDPVKEATLSNGSWVRAAGIDFMVYFEAATRPSSGQISTLPVALREQALEELRAAMRDGPLYAVLDSARNDRVLTVLREAVEEHRSLYDGVTADRMADGAPYIVRFREDSGLLTRLVMEGWGDAWGIYLTSQRPLNEVRAHLRKLIMVSLEEDGVPEGEPVYFRFYDPRVMEAFLPIVNSRQEDEIFGDVQRFLYEDSEGRLARGARAPVSKPR